MARSRAGQWHGSMATWAAQPSRGSPEARPKRRPLPPVCPSAVCQRPARARPAQLTAAQRRAAQHGTSAGSSAADCGLGSTHLCIMAWRSRSAAVEPEPEPAPVADMVEVLAEDDVGSRGMASVESVGMALLDLWAIWRGLGRAVGDVGCSEGVRVTSLGRFAVVVAAGAAVAAVAAAAAAGGAAATSTRSGAGAASAGRDDGECEKLPADGRGNEKVPASRSSVIIKALDGQPAKKTLLLVDRACAGAVRRRPSLQGRQPERWW